MSVDARVASRVDALVSLFEHIATTRMAGLPVMHPGLAVEAVGFAPHTPAEAPGVVGVLVTPWFMNLVWFPCVREDEPRRVGHTQERTLGDERFEFIGAHEPAFGCYEACSLFSPMFQFEGREAARATAQAVIDALRAPAVALPAAPARRAFLFGRSAAVGVQPR